MCVYFIANDEYFKIKLNDKVDKFIFGVSVVSCCAKNIYYLKKS